MYKNTKDCEATLGMYDILDKGEKLGLGGGISISEVRTGDLQVVEEEQSTRGRETLAR